MWKQKSTGQPEKAKENASLCEYERQWWTEKSQRAIKKNLKEMTENDNNSNKDTESKT